MLQDERDLDNFDLVDLVYQATNQIPEGMVSTYGDVAKALGDVRASRLVGMILSSYPRTYKVACHRVVYGDGTVGWYYGKGQGTDRKEAMLRSEGVRIEDGTVQNWETTRFSDFRIRPVLKEMADLQTTCSKKVDARGKPRFDRVIGLDVSYEGEDAYTAAAIIDMEGNIETRTALTKVLFPYVPTYLGFRELPAYLPLLRDVKDALVFVDGQGQLHPRGFGIACQIGLRTGLPTIGAAKSILVGKQLDDGTIELDGRRTGQKMMLGGREYFISVGNGLSLDSAMELSELFLSDPERDVLRLAHKAAGRFRKGGKK